MADPCPHGMPSRPSCVDCMEDGPVAEPERWQKVGDPFTAIYAGQCPCGGYILREHSEIERWDKGDRTTYTHVGCRP